MAAGDRLVDRVLGDGALSIFNAGALVYDLLTAQRFWRDQIASVLGYVEGRRPLRVLDLGCGPGVSTFVLAERLGGDSDLVGVDLAHKMVARAQRHHRRYHAALTNVRFEQADATRLPHDEGSFDLAVGHSFLYLVPDRPAVLAEVRRVLAPGGTLVLMEPRAGGSLLEAASAVGPRWRGASTTPWQASRFVASLVLWRLVSSNAGRMSPGLVEQLFAAAGFREVESHPTLAGLGLHCVGRV